MSPSLLCSLVTLSALSLLAACASPTAEATRPAPDASTLGSLAADAPGAPASELVLSRDVCASDADCVPSTCCHAPSCMSREKATPCDNMMCTQVCQPGTIDCGGSCLCSAGRCAARLGNGGN